MSHYKKQSVFSQSVINDSESISKSEVTYLSINDSSRQLAYLSLIIASMPHYTVAQEATLLSADMIQALEIASLHRTNIESDFSSNFFDPLFFDINSSSNLQKLVVVNEQHHTDENQRDILLGITSSQKTATKNQEKPQTEEAEEEEESEYLFNFYPNIFEFYPNIELIIDVNIIDSVIFNLDLFNDIFQYEEMMLLEMIDLFTETQTVTINLLAQPDRFVITATENTSIILEDLNLLADNGNGEDSGIGTIEITEINGLTLNNASNGIQVINLGTDGQLLYTIANPHGVSYNPNSSLITALEFGQQLTTTFTYTITDDTAETSTATATVTVYGVRDVFSLATDITTNTGFIIRGDANGSVAGSSVSGGGDYNSSGQPDILVNQPYYSEIALGNSPGENYVIFSENTNNDTTLNNLNSADRLRVDLDPTAAVSNTVGGQFSEITHIGDINNDGIDDFIITAPRIDAAVLANNSSNPEAYVIFGNNSLTGNLDSSTLSGGNGFAITGFETLTTNTSPTIGKTFLTADAAGDVNGDGIDDFVIGASYTNSDDGQAYVIYGSKNYISSSYDITTLNNDENELAGFNFTDGAANKSFLGSSVAGVGDFNNDGFADVLVSAPGEKDNNNNIGTNYLILGSTSLTGQYIEIKSAANNTTQSGFDVSSAGDFNSDGFDDFILSGNDGVTYLIYGYDTTGLRSTNTIDLDTLAVDGYGFAITSASGTADYDISNIGDFDGDGFDDIIVGDSRAIVDGNTNTGVSYLLFGRSSIVDIDLDNLTQAEGFIIEGIDAGDRAGYSVSGLGDIDGDGFTDVIIGAPGADNPNNNTITDVGESYVIYGQNLGAVDFEGTDSVDNLIANDSNNVLIGAQGDDTLNGAGGNDLINGASGNDELIGGGGADRFIFQVGSGQDSIQDFNQSEGDLLDLSDYDIYSINQIKIISQGNNTTLILDSNITALADANNTITLIGVNASDVDDSTLF